MLRKAAAVALSTLVACTSVPPKPSNADLQKQVADTERAFAKTMADRDHAAFTSFLSEETIFFTVPKPLHGKAEVAAAWKRFYEGPKAPFSWSPETVEVLESGTLALSSGPVFDPSGKRFATFSSIWRQEAPGVWRIVFDRGNPDCICQ
ncbi:MAG TPA: nuclear transport factor 2 family protein [Casimicrobiaceae bacterium]|nr:nuclear transport factor 2 family protein [Casimicrobiaceae bacterium]